MMNGTIKNFQYHRLKSSVCVLSFLGTTVTSFRVFPDLNIVCKISTFLYPAVTHLNSSSNEVYGDFDFNLSSTIAQMLDSWVLKRATNFGVMWAMHGCDTASCCKDCTVYWIDIPVHVSIACVWCIFDPLFQPLFFLLFYLLMPIQSPFKLNGNTPQISNQKINFSFKAQQLLHILMSMSSQLIL